MITGVTCRLTLCCAADDIHAIWADADVVDFWTNVGYLPTYLRHRQLRPTLVRCAAGSHACPAAKLWRDLRMCHPAQIATWFLEAAEHGNLGGRLVSDAIYKCQ